MSLHNKNQTAKHTSQQQTIRTNHHPAHSHPMAVTANTPRGGDRPPPRKKNDHETTAKGGKSRKKRSASDDGNTADKSHTRLSTEGDEDKNEDTGTNGVPGDGECMTATNGLERLSTKGDGAMTPHDHDAETNLQKDPRGGNRPPPHKKNDPESMDKGGKSQKKRSASDEGNTVNKSHKWLSAEGHFNKKQRHRHTWSAWGW